MSDMSDMDTSASLSRIQTCWTDLFKAHEGPGEPGGDVLHRLVLRYYGAVYRYLCRVLRDPSAADSIVSCSRPGANSCSQLSICS